MKKNVVVHNRSKGIAIKSHFIQEAANKKVIKMSTANPKTN